MPEAAEKERELDFFNKYPLPDSDYHPTFFDSIEKFFLEYS